MVTGEQQNTSVYKVHVTSTKTAAIAGYAIVVFIILSFVSSFLRRSEFIQGINYSNYSTILFFLFFGFIIIFPKLIRKKGEIRMNGKELIITYNGEEKHLVIDSNLSVKTRPKGGWVCTIKNNLDVDVEAEFLSGIDLTKFMKQVWELQGGHLESNSQITFKGKTYGLGELDKISGALPFLNKAMNGKVSNLLFGKGNVTKESTQNVGGNPIEQIDSKKQIIRLFVGVAAAAVLYLLYIKLK